MASNLPGACCVSGFRHEGTPEGEIRKINDIETYFAGPKQAPASAATTTPPPPPEKAIIFVSDVLGIYINSQLLADEFAAKGYLVVVPDLFQGDAIQPEAFDLGKVDLPAWLARHPPESIDPVVESTIKYLRQDLGVEKIGAVGYCAGAKYVIRYLNDAGLSLDVGYVAHPSFVTHEELGAISKPLSISASEIDSIFTTELRHQSEDILIKTGQPWQINLFSTVAHGFAVRADLRVKHGKFAKEQAFAQAVAWFQEHL